MSPKPTIRPRQTHRVCQDVPCYFIAESAYPLAQPPSSTDPNASFVKQPAANATPKSAFKRIAKWAIIFVVLLFLGLTLRRAYLDLQMHRDQLDISKMALSWIVFGGAVYILGMLPASQAWLQTLDAFQQKVPFWTGMQAYFLGHLGKYIPGKAMVFVLRVSRLREIGIEVKPTIVSIFVETLTSVSTGAILGCALLLCQSPRPPDWMLWNAILCIPCAFLFLVPHTFRWVLGVLAKSRIGRMPKEVSEAFTWKLMLRNCLWMALGWCLHGTASWLVLIGLQPDGSLWSVQAWTVCTAAALLGAVVGFASMIPGGAIVRELVITWLLTSLVPQPIALAAAVVFRVVGLACELILILGLSFTQRRQKPS